MTASTAREKTTVFRNLSKIVAWDRAASTHTYISNGDLAFKGNEIIQVGGTYSGHWDTELCGENRMAIPGLINMH
ncbi:MAG: hypothetical protein L0H70_08585, partial [Xanthomonadales bacterium]|nr:hypothetical protein [Xanthomonadales bacterium]